MNGAGAQDQHLPVAPADASRRLDLEPSARLEKEITRHSCRDAPILATFTTLDCQKVETHLHSLAFKRPVARMLRNNRPHSLTGKVG